LKNPFRSSKLPLRTKAPYIRRAFGGIVAFRNLVP